jgi:magnesium chelatase family protein
MTARGVVLSDLDGQLVEVTAHLGTGSGDQGLLDQLDIAETLDRARAALVNSGLAWPAEPVRLRVEPAVHLSALLGGDLAVACAVLSAGGHLPAHWLAHTALVGELGLDGQVRPVRGVLAAVRAAYRAGLRRIVVPQSQLAEAMLVPDMRVFGAHRLTDVIAASHQEPVPAAAVDPSPAAPPAADPDLADVVGQPEGVAAVEIAAAGGHHLLLLGEPGSGTSMLARRLPALLPDLTGDQALEVTAIHSLAGTLTSDAPLITRPPLVTPHHSTSLPALIGGGIGPARPGAVSRAHCGVLVLEDAAEWGQQRLEAVRTAVDAGEIRLARRNGVMTFPARPQLVLTSPPCRCAAGSACTCTAPARRRYLARFTGPLLDRIELRVWLRPVAPHDGPRDWRADPTPVIRDRVHQARERAARRWAADGGLTNADVPASVLLRGLSRAATAPIDDLLARGALTRRGADRTLRVSWTLADLAGLPQPGADQIAEALAFRDRRPA